MQLIIHNGYATGVENSDAFRDYLGKRRIEETSPRNYRVPGGVRKYTAIGRLLRLSQDMMLEFDVIPTGADPNHIRLEFANQLGVFYIDGIRK